MKLADSVGYSIFDQTLAGVKGGCIVYMGCLETWVHRR